VALSPGPVRRVAHGCSAAVQPALEEGSKGRAIPGPAPILHMAGRFCL